MGKNLHSECRVGVCHAMTCFVPPSLLDLTMAIFFSNIVRQKKMYSLKYKILATLIDILSWTHLFLPLA